MNKIYTLFGDSIPKGIITVNGQLSKTKSVVDIIANELGITIINKSIYGQTLQRINSKGIIKQYIEEIKSNPELKYLTILAIGGNDSDYEWAQITPDNYKNHEPKTPIKDFVNILETVIAELQKVGSEIIICTIPPVNSEKYFENILCTKYDSESILKFFGGDISNIERCQERYSSQLMETALKMNCRLIDLRSDFLMQKNYLDYMCDDGIHPNELGHQFMAKQILNHLKNDKLTSKI